MGPFVVAFIIGLHQFIWRTESRVRAAERNAPSAVAARVHFLGTPSTLCVGREVVRQTQSVGRRQH